jgi:hypothetical protein
MTKAMKEAHRFWAEGMAKSLNRTPDEHELESLGRVPWEAAWKAATEHAREELFKLLQNKELTWQEVTDQLWVKLSQ